MTWVLVVRTNNQSGSSEIWRAFAPSTLSSVTVTATLSQSVVSSMTVVTFSGVNAGGTNGSAAIGAIKSASAGSGAPTASLDMGVHLSPAMRDSVAGGVAMHVTRSSRTQ